MFFRSYYEGAKELDDEQPYCLHLWKKIGEEYETPPKEYVG